MIRMFCAAIIVLAVCVTVTCSSAIWSVDMGQAPMKGKAGQPRSGTDKQ